MTHYLDQLELSVKTANLLRAKEVTEYQFLTLTKQAWRSMGGLVKGWKEIEEVRQALHAARNQRRRETTIGKAIVAVRTLNEIRAELRNENLFITRDDEGLFRVGRYITKEDINELTGN